MKPRNPANFFLPALLIIFSAGAMLLAQDPPQPRYLFKDVAQDGQGVVWGIYNTLLLFNGKTWSPVPVPFAPDDSARPIRLTRMPDGAVDCVWQLSRERIAVTRHTSAETRLLGTCPGRFATMGLRPPPFADSHNRLWITNPEGAVYRADGDGQVALVYSIPPSQLIDTTAEAIKNLANFAAEDGRGRVWIWSNSRENMLTGADLRGVLLFNDNKAELQEKFNGITGSHFSFIGRKDEKHMWVAVMQEGLYTVDIDTFEVKPVDAPEPEAFRYMQKVISSGDDLFVIASRTGGPFRNALWRQHDGKWTCLVANMDNRPANGLDFTRPWLRSGGDTIFCAFDAAPWLVHEDGTVDRLDFRHGLTIEDARTVFLLSDGRLMANGTFAQNFCGHVSFTAASGPSRASELVFLHHAWTTDAEGNVWMIRSEKGNVLSQWDGSQWLEHPCPPEMDTLGFLGAAIDTQGRVWLLPNGAWTAFFDPHTGKWRLFPDMQAMFKEMKNDSPRFTDDRREYCVPDYSADSQRIAFRDRNVEVVYFDGKEWRRWKRPDIDTKGGHNIVTLGSPFFDQSDHLCVCLGKETWQLDDQSHWQQKQVEAKFPDDATPGSQSRPKVTPPDECITHSPDSIVSDNQDVAWLTWQGKLYKCGYGKCVEVFSNGEANPFADHRKISDAWVAPRGNAFLKTAFDKGVMIAPASPLPPKPSITLEKTTPDSVSAKLQAGSEAATRFRWKLDNGPWQLAKDPSFALQNLANGAHTLTAMAIDEQLQTSVSAVATVDIQIDPQEQMAALIKSLGDPDMAKRESSSAALTRQPDAALPALKAARPKADATQAWWIDATIQEIERNAAKAATPPGK